MMIRFDRFTKRFGDLTAVDALSLEVGAGEIVAMIGPNGSGKTTSLKAAAGLLKPTAGTVQIGLEDATRPSARRAISFLPQKVTFPDTLTGREVVEFYCRLRGLSLLRMTETLRMAALNGASNRSVGTYSGGMSQRLGLAVAALPPAAVLLLDEPTAALDPEGLTVFYTMAERVRQDGRSVMFTSHQLGDVGRLADRFAILVAGRLVAVMTARQLSDELNRRGRMRLELDRPAEIAIPAVAALVPDATATGNRLTVSGPPEFRARVLDAVRNSGAVIQSLTTEEGLLENLYKELVS